MDGTAVVTSSLMWQCALVTALIDTPLLVLVARFVPRRLFRSLKGYLVGVAFLLYAALWGFLGSLRYWDSVYHVIFPGWFRWLLAPTYGLLFGVLALAFWRLSLLAARWPALWFCLLGGLVSLVGHGIGISRGLMSVPMLAQVSPASALTFGVFEFIFYWCAIVGLGAAVRALVLRRRRP